jgi:hypothetical protein
MGGSPPGQPRLALVRVNAGTYSGTTPTMLAQMYASDHTAHAVTDLGDGAFETVTDDAITHKIGYAVSRNGHLVIVEIEFAGALASADRMRAHDATKAFLAAL